MLQRGRGGSSGSLLDDDGAPTRVELMLVVGGNLGPQLCLIYVTGRYWHSMNTFNVTGSEKACQVRPKTSSRWPRMEAHGHQDGFKMRRAGPQMAQDDPKMRGTGRQDGPRRPQDATHWAPVAQAGAKMKQDRSRRERMNAAEGSWRELWDCLLYTSPSPRDATLSRMPSSA